MNRQCTKKKKKRVSERNIKKNKHMGKCPTSLVTRDTQIKIVCVCFPDELAEMKNKEY